MSIRDAVEQTPHLHGSWKTGLEGLRSQDRRHMAAEDTRNLTGSVYLDEELLQQREHSQAHRWDYAIGYQHANRDEEYLYWVEIHAASTGEVNIVLEKLRWLKQ